MGGGSRSTGYLSPWWYSHHELSTFEIEKRLGNNGLPPGIQQLSRSRNDSEVTDGCHPECGPNAMPRCVDAVTFSRPLASSWPVTLLLSISAASMGETLCCMLACPHIPMCGLRALGPHVVERIRACSFAAAALLQAPSDGCGRVVPYAQPLCPKLFGISSGSCGPCVRIYSI